MNDNTTTIEDLLGINDDNIPAPYPAPSTSVPAPAPFIITDPAEAQATLAAFLGASNTNNAVQAPADTGTQPAKKRNAPPAIDSPDLYTPTESPLPPDSLSTDTDISLLLNNALQGLLRATGIDKDEVEIGIELDEPTSNSFRWKRIRGGYKIVVGLKAVADIAWDAFYIRLLHELAHIKNDYEYIEDISGSGVYHTEPFSKTLTALGGLCAWNRSKGYAGNTSITIQLASQLQTATAQIGQSFEQVIISKHSPLFKKTKAAQTRNNRLKIYKIICPMCDDILYVQGDQITTFEKYAEQNPEALDQLQPEND